jgi:hypothetical protein
MTERETEHNDKESGERELPEAFTMNAGQEVSHLSQPPAQGRTGSDLDKVREGSEESFPASDPPSVMPPTTIPKGPVEPGQ